MSLKYANYSNTKPKNITKKIGTKKVAQELGFEDRIGNAVLNNAMTALEKKRDAAVPGSPEWKKLVKQIVSAGGNVKKGY